MNKKTKLKNQLKTLNVTELTLDEQKNHKGGFPPAIPALLFAVVGALMPISEYLTRESRERKN